MASAPQPAAKAPLDPAGLLSLFIVYVVWGTTFLAMRIGVREGSGFPSWLFGGTRVLAAGLILALLAVLARQSLRVPRRELVALAVSGILIWITGHGVILWAEIEADSGYAGLFIAAFPIWAAVFDAVIDRRMPSLKLVGALVVGLGGVAVLAAPELLAEKGLPALVILALVTGSVSWAAGFTVQRRGVRTVPPAAGAALQHLAAAPLFFVIAWAAGNDRPDPSYDAWLAWGYLVVFGSIVAFTAAYHALQRLPGSVAMTYAYVNPAVAVVAGHLALNEPVSGWTAVGAALVLLGVWGVFRAGKPVPPRPGVTRLPR